MALPSLEFWQGAGAAAVPFVAWLLKLRLSRENRAQTLYDRIMTEVRAENLSLRVELETYKQRDARMLIIETCFRMVLPELLKLDPQNSVLVHVKVLLEAGPLPSTTEDWTEVLSRIDREGEGNEQVG